MAGITEDEQRYYDALCKNYLYGISGLTQQQSLAGAQDILGAISAGNLRGYLTQDPGMVNAYLSGFSNLGTYTAMAQGLEEKGVKDPTGGIYTMNDILSLEEGSTAYDEVSAALDE